MDKYVFILLTALFSNSVTLQPSITKQYRTDYVYNKKTDAFYKLHTETQEGWHADSYCQMENAQLLVPTTHEDIVQVHAMLKQFPDIGEYVLIGQDGQDHESAEEQPIIDLSSMVTSRNIVYEKTCDTLTRNGDTKSIPCYWRAPFVCKLEAKDAHYDERCGVYGNLYTYEASVGSCYKITAKDYTWNQAYAECRHEGAHLVVVNSQAEDLVIKRLMISAPKPYNVHLGYFLAGFRAEKTNSTTRVFKTIFNQTLEEAGFSLWSPDEPNNRLGQEYCGSITTTDGMLNDICCFCKFRFICEKEVIL